jgi:ABC-type dipeptide/oligopeptide/nickel transport system permease subunit
VKRWAPCRPTRNLAIGFLSLLLLAGLLSDWVATLGSTSATALQSGLGSAGKAELFSWWLLATRDVLAVSATATLVGALLGSVLGALAIYGSGGLGGGLSRLVGFMGAFPGLLLVGLFRLGDPSRGVLALLGALSLFRTLEVAQLVRAELLEALLGDAVEASRALGASRRWQVRAHVVPRLARPLAANLLQGASALIGLEAALSFVGLGLPAGVPSWGGGLAAVVATQSALPLGVAAASIGLSCAALYGLGASLAGTPPRPGGAAAAPLVALGAAGPGS